MRSTPSPPGPSLPAVKAADIFTSGSRQEQLRQYAALVREAADRALDERPYNSQIIGLIGLLDAAAGAEGWDDQEDEISDELADLLDSVFVGSVPIARRLLERLEECGWRGWTKLERVAP